MIDEKSAKEKRKIHVNGIPKEWKNADLENYFKQFVLSFFLKSPNAKGEIEEAFVCFEKGTQNSRGFGFVTFAKKEDYDKILEPATREEDGFTLTISKVALTAPDDRLKLRRPYAPHCALRSPLARTIAIGTAVARAAALEADRDRDLAPRGSVAATATDAVARAAAAAVAVAAARRRTAETTITERKRTRCRCSAIRAIRRRAIPHRAIRRTRCRDTRRRAIRHSSRTIRRDMRLFPRTTRRCTRTRRTTLRFLIMMRIIRFLIDLLFV